MKPLSLNVLVVDDELPLRQELRSFPWEECGAELIGEAGNGEEALQLCEARLPDVVITDITMPIMDGITLIRELKQRYPAVQIILLTCHSDFHYVQEALRLGALEYLLKVSMEEEELKQALGKVREAIAKERHLRRIERTERRMLQASLLGRLLHGSELGSEEWDQLGLNKGSVYVWVRLFLDAPGMAYYAAKQRIQQTLSDLESAGPNGLIWLSYREKEYFLLVEAHHPALASGLLENTIQTLAGCLKEYARQPISGESAYAVVSEPFSTEEELKQAVAGTSDWQAALFYDGTSAFGLFIGEPPSLSELTDEQAKEMSGMLRRAGRSAASLQAYLDEEFRAWCMERRIRPQQLKQRLLGWLVEWLKEQDLAELDSTSFTRLMGASSLKQMINELIEAISELDSRKISSRVEIRSAILWMKQNMKQQISLPVLAEQVGLSPHYVSRLFREETGATVNQYITRLRMEKAVELLKGTNKKVYEIAEEVGIPSYRYFTLTFRNWTGVSPTDYKRKS